MTTNPFDATTLPTTPPDQIVAGSYAAWRQPLDFSSDTYALRCDLVPRETGATLSVDGEQDGSHWLFEIPGATSSAWAAGEYRLNMILVRLSDSEEAQIGSEHITVFASTSDRRTHAEIMVEKIESILNGRAAHDVESYSIKSRSITRMSVRDLTQWRDYYLDEIARTGGSVQRRSGANPTTLRVRFT